MSLLDEGTGGEVNRRALEDTARQLEETLIQHGVDATLTKIVPGPTVTRYEIELAPGVKVNRVSSLSHDSMEPYRTLFADHLMALHELAAEIEDVTRQNRRLAGPWVFSVLTRLPLPSLLDFLR